MDQASGVNIFIDDQSVVIPGSNELEVLVPMLTTKGKVGQLNVVNAQNFKDVLGYDLNYNPNYAGLEKMLEWLNHVSVLRINQNAVLANRYYNSTGVLSTDNTLLDFNTLKEMEPQPKLAVALRDPGNPGNFTVKFEPAYHEKKATVNFDETLTIQGLADETLTIGTETVFGGVEIYDSEGYELLAVISADKKSVLRVDAGKVTDTVIGTVAVGSGEQDHDYTITWTTPISNVNLYLFKTLSSSYDLWNLKLLETVNTVSYVRSTTSFSVVASDDNYWEKVDFGALQLFITDNSILQEADLRAGVALESGSNGLAESALLAPNMDLTVLNNTSCNIWISNGLKRIPILNKLGTKADALFCYLFIGVPYYKNHEDAAAWKDPIVHTDKVILVGRPSIEDTELGSAYICPSIQYAYIYSQMQTQTGSLLYPPAGYTYGLVNVTALAEVDYPDYASFMKTARINYIISSADGSCIWEQRNNYAKNTDLSYINTSFIITELRARIVQLEKIYNFRYMRTVDLNNNESALTSLLDSMKDGGFLYDYQLDFPSYAEAQSTADRSLNIKIGVQPTKDAEIINITLILKNN